MKNIKWFAVTAAFVLACAVIMGVISVCVRNPYTLSLSGVLAVVGTGIAIMAAKED